MSLKLRTSFLKHPRKMWKAAAVSYKSFLGNSKMNTYEYYEPFYTYLRRLSKTAVLIQFLKLQSLRSFLVY